MGGALSPWTPNRQSPLTVEALGSEETADEVVTRGFSCVFTHFTTATLWTLAGIEPAKSCDHRIPCTPNRQSAVFDDQPARCRPRYVSLPKRDVIRTGSGLIKTLVGVEPTSTGLQPVASPSGSSVAYFLTIANSTAS